MNIYRVHSKYYAIYVDCMSGYVEYSFHCMLTNIGRINIIFILWIQLSNIRRIYDDCTEYDSNWYLFNIFIEREIH